MSAAAHRTVVLLLVGIGAALWIKSEQAKFPLLQVVAVGVAAVAALLPSVRRRIQSLPAWLTHPSAAARARIAVTIYVLSALFLYGVADLQQREMWPHWHDEYSYLIEAQIMAGGRLWMPSHPLADFFESFHLLVKPVYASIYFPGTAMLHTPGVWLGLPYWVVPLLIASGIVTLFYRIVAEMVSGSAGLMAAMLLLSLSEFRHLSLMVMSHPAVMLLSLLMVWAYLRWRTGQGWGWAACIGAMAGWAAITRPIDALCYAAPVGLLMLGGLWKRPARRWLLTMAMLVAGASPFLGLQLIFNHGITGSWTQSPYAYYLERYAPNLGFGFKPYDPSLRPRTELLQKHVYHETFNEPVVAYHRPGIVLPRWINDWGPMLARINTPATVLIVLLPLGFWGMRRELWALAGMLPLFVALYSFYPFLIQPYCVVAAPTMILLIVLGAGTVVRLTTENSRPRIRTLLGLSLVALAVTGLPGINPFVRDEVLAWPTMKYVNEVLPQMVQTPAVVLFRYTPRDNPHEEPVYNIGAANPDDVPIIHANDLGGVRNLEILRYYGQRQPERMFYLFDRTNAELRPLGTAGHLLRKLSSGERIP